MLNAASINDLMGVLDQVTNGNMPAYINRSLIYPNDPIGMNIHDDQSNGTYLMRPVLPPANTGWLPAMASAIQRTPCPWPGCSESVIHSTNVDRHVDSIQLGIKYHCFRVGCPNNGRKGYCRLEKLRTHQRKKHDFALM